MRLRWGGNAEIMRATKASMCDNERRKNGQQWRIENGSNL